MIFQLKQFKRRCRYYFGYMYSVLFYVAPSLLAADLFEQGEDYIAFLMLGTGYLMSILFFVASRKDPKYYHEVRHEFAGLYAKLDQLEKRGD